jgi:3-dehydroquinate dehydratase
VGNMMEFTKVILAENRKEAENKFKKWFTNQCIELKIDSNTLTYSIRSPGSAQKAIDKRIGQKGYEYIFTYREKKTKKWK